MKLLNISVVIAAVALLGVVSANPILNRHFIGGIRGPIFKPTPIFQSEERRSLGPVGSLYAEEQKIRHIFRTFCRFLQDPDEEVREQLAIGDLVDSARRIALTACKEFQDPGNEKADAQWIGAALGALSLLSNLKNAFGTSEVEKQRASLEQFSALTPLAKEQDLQQWIDKSKLILSYLCDFIQAPSDEDQVTEQFSMSKSARRIALSVCKEVQDPGERKPMNENLANVERFRFGKLIDKVTKIVGAIKNIKNSFGKPATAEFDFSNLDHNVDTDKQDEFEMAKEEYYHPIGFLPGSHERSKQILQELEDLSKESQ